MGLPAELYPKYWKNIRDKSQKLDTTSKFYVIYFYVTVIHVERNYIIRKNIYTYKVDETIIKFTGNLRDDFWRLYLTDMPVKEIFRTLGYDPELFGTKRNDGFVYNLRQELLTDGQRLNSISGTSKIRRPSSDTKYSDMKSKEEIKAMENELAYLSQEVDLKLYSLVPLQTTEEE